MQFKNKIKTWFLFNILLSLFLLKTQSYVSFLIELTIRILRFFLPEKKRTTTLEDDENTNTTRRWSTGQNYRWVSRFSSSSSQSKMVSIYLRARALYVTCGGAYIEIKKRRVEKAEKKSRPRDGWPLFSPHCPEAHFLQLHDTQINDPSEMF